MACERFACLRRFSSCHVFPVHTTYSMMRSHEVGSATSLKGAFMDHLNRDEVQNGVGSTLYDRFAATILASLCKLVSDRHDDEDLLLEFFMAAFITELLSHPPAGSHL